MEIKLPATRVYILKISGTKRFFRYGNKKDFQLGINIIPGKFGITFGYAIGE